MTLKPMSFPQQAVTNGFFLQVYISPYQDALNFLKDLRYLFRSTLQLFVIHSHFTEEFFWIEEH